MKSRDEKGRFTKTKKEGNMETITIKKVTVNGKMKTTWNDENDLAYVLRSIYKTHGEFYLQVLGVSIEESKQADWNPYSTLFDRFISYGWDRMLKAGGKITKTETTETVSVYDAVFGKKE